MTVFLCVLFFCLGVLAGVPLTFWAIYRASKKFAEAKTEAGVKVAEIIAQRAAERKAATTKGGLN